MKSPNTEKRSSEELKTEVHKNIRKVKSDIEEFERRLTPGQIIDDVIFYRHGRSPTATINHLKNNPIGTALLSLGTLLLMENENHTTYESNVKGQLPRVRSKVSQYKHDLQTKTSEIRHRFEKSHERKSLGADFEGADQGPSRKEKWKENLEHAREQMSSGFQSSKERIQHLDPLTLVSLGASLGALTGASLPLGESERRMVDSRFSGKLSSFSQDLEVAINQSANILKDLVVQDVKGLNINLF